MFPYALIYLKDDFPMKQPDELAPGEYLVKMHCTGVCHSDLYACNGDWPLTPNSRSSVITKASGNRHSWSAHDQHRGSSGR
jgi:threonine dehydrogenase-like Zn-dependent dehydrogenase